MFRRCILAFGFAFFASFPIACGLPAVAFEIGIDRSNLTRQPLAVQEKTMQGIAALGATWFRDGIGGDDPEATDGLVNEVRLAKKYNLKFLAVVSRRISDYPEGYRPANAGPEFRQLCGWGQGAAPYSEVDLARFSRRFQAQLTAVKSRGLTIDAFEIGNEVNLMCFNGDVPNGHAASPEEYQRLLRGYARFLKTAATIIRDKRNFPGAKIITFGIAHGGSTANPNPHFIADPARIIADLKNLDGFNYLDNQFYRVDGYGSHLYPPARDITGHMEARQEVRLKQAEAAKYKRLTETRSLNQPAAIIGFIRGGVHRESA